MDLEMEAGGVMGNFLHKVVLGGHVQAVFLLLDQGAFAVGSLRVCTGQHDRAPSWIYPCTLFYYLPAV